MTAPSENVSVKLTTTLYGNVVVNEQKNFTNQAGPLFHVDKSIKMRKPVTILWYHCHLLVKGVCGSESVCSAPSFVNPISTDSLCSLIVKLPLLS